MDLHCSLLRLVEVACVHGQASREVPRASGGCRHARERTNPCRSKARSSRFPLERTASFRRSDAPLRGGAPTLQLQAGKPAVQPCISTGTSSTRPGASRSSLTTPAQLTSPRADDGWYRPAYPRLCRSVRPALAGARPTSYSSEGAGPLAWRPRSCVLGLRRQHGGDATAKPQDRHH